MSPLVLSGWYVQYMLILTPLCCLQVEELLYFSLSVAQLPDLSLWHHHYRVSAVQPRYWRWAGPHEIISMNSKWAGVLINMNPWKHEWFWRRLVGPPLSDYITCMWHVCTSMFSLLFCMLSPPPTLTLPLCLSSFPSLVSSMVCRRVCDLNFNISVCLPARLLGCCCPEILVFPPLDSQPCWFFPPSLSLSWQCNHIAKSQLHSVNHLNNLYKLKLSNESLIWLLWTGKLDIYSPL